MMNKEELMRHLREDQKYPANKVEIMAECDNLSDVSEEDRKMMRENLPEGTYSSADEVMKAVEAKANMVSAGVAMA